MILKGFLGMGTILVKTGVVRQSLLKRAQDTSTLSVILCQSEDTMGTSIQEGPQTMRVCPEQCDQDGERP